MKMQRFWIIMTFDHWLRFIRSQFRVSNVLVWYRDTHGFWSLTKFQKHWNSWWQVMILESSWMLIIGYGSFVQNLEFSMYWFYMGTCMCFEAWPNSRNIYENAMILESSWIFIIGYFSFLHNLEFPTYSFYIGTRMVFEAWPNSWNIEIPYRNAMMLESSWVFIIICILFAHNLEIPTYWFYTGKRMVVEV